VPGVKAPNLSALTPTPAAAHRLCHPCREAAAAHIAGLDVDGLGARLVGHPFDLFPSSNVMRLSWCWIGYSPTAKNLAESGKSASVGHRFRKGERTNQVARGGAGRVQARYRSAARSQPARAQSPLIIFNSLLFFVFYALVVAGFHGIRSWTLRKACERATAQPASKLLTIALYDGWALREPCA
jgi:hypothetical protein